MKILALIFLLTSCAGLMPTGSPREGKRVYAYIDASGRYVYTREHKLIKNKLISRSQISSNQGSALKPLEKSIMVSQLGSVKDQSHRALVIRPYATEFSVWLEGKRYDSRMRLDPKNKAMALDLNSPEAKWKGRSSVPFPKGKQFCFFSQIPECLYHNLYLSRALERKGERFAFYVVWDSYPFLQDLLTGVGGNLFAPAVLKYEGEQKSVLKYQVEVSGQTVLYQFSKSFDLVRMFWIAQGISIVPPGEDVSDVEE